MRGPYRGDASVGVAHLPKRRARLAAVLAGALVVGAGLGFGAARVFDRLLTPPFVPQPISMMPVSGRPFAFDEAQAREAAAVDIASCARPGGPAGPGFVLLELDPDPRNERVLCAPSAVKLVSSGRTQRPSFSATYAGTEVGRCITERYASVKLSPFRAGPSPASVVVPFTLAVDGRPFDAAAAEAALRVVDLRACPTQGRGELDVSFLPSGAVRARAPQGHASISIEGPRSGRPGPVPLDFLERCVERAFSRVSVAPFGGSEIIVRWPYRT